MRVLLIQPGLPGGINIVPQCAPPMGLMYIASYLRASRPKDEIKILDLQVNRMPPHEAGRLAAQYKPDVTGITSMSVHAPVAHEIALHVKSAHPSTTVVLGGPYSVSAPEVILRDKNVDAVAPGEGEQTFLEFVQALESKSGFDDIPGLWIRNRDGEASPTGTRPYISDLDSLPLPARDLIDIEKFYEFDVLTQNDMRAHREYTTIFTSRACPYRCIFCHNIFGKKFRARSAENVLAEMESLYRSPGIREFHIIDDCFNLETKRAMEIMDGILKRGLKIRMAFPNGIRADKLPDELLDLMRRAGVYKMNFGIESGSARIQKLIHKHLNLETLKDAVERADRRGIITHGFFMLGFPGETEEEMNETIKFACSSKLMMAGFNLVTPYPNTELHEVAKQMGYLKKFDGHEGCYTDAGTNMSATSHEKLVELHRKAYRRFYLNPVRMAKIAWRIPHKSDLYRALRAQLKIKFF